MQPARFGINGNFAHHLLQRLDAVVTNEPDEITVLIGTNDARAGLAAAEASQAYSRMIAGTAPQPRVVPPYGLGSPYLRSSAGGTSRDGVTSGLSVV